MEPKPFGLKEIVVASMDGETVIALPAALEMEFEETVVSGEFYGNDDLQGIVTQPLGVKGKFKQGGYPAEAISVMTGHTYDTTGSTPNEVQTLEADSTSYPYFQIFGKSLGDEGDDVHIKVFKAKLTTGVKGSFKRGEFFMPETEFMGVKVDGKAWESASHETAEPLDIPGS